MTEADLIVIGAGQGGVPLASRCAKNGMRVVLMERGEIGGSCVNYGCTPSKTLLASAHAAGRARRAEAVGISCRVGVDFEAVMRRVREMRLKWRAGATEGLERSRVRIIRAEAHFVGPRTVEAQGETFTAATIVIDTGTSPALPPIEGLEGAPILTNVNVFDCERRPERLIVIGGGYIGLELGQGFARLGSAVTVLQRAGHILNREDEDVSDAIARALVDDGLGVRLNSSAKRLSHAPGRDQTTRFTVTLENDDALDSDAVLVATGRRPNTVALDAGASGIDLDERGYVRVDEHLRTTCGGVFAIGDCAGRPAFTHVSWEDHRRVLAQLTGDDGSSRAGGVDRTRDDLPLAYTTFTDPQVARVGMSEREAREAGRDVRTARLGADSIARAIEFGHTHAYFKLVVDGANDRILGAALVGYEAGELVHALLPYVRHGLTWRDLEQAMHIHPTYGEALPSLARKLMR